MLIADLICAADNTRTMRAIVGPQVIENGSNAISPNARFSLISSCSSVLCVFQCFLCQVLSFPPLFKNTQTFNIFTHFLSRVKCFFQNKLLFLFSPSYLLSALAGQKKALQWFIDVSIQSALFTPLSVVFTCKYFSSQKIVFSHVNISGLSLQNPKQ